jgi:hypothetical protein
MLYLQPLLGSGFSGGRSPSSGFPNCLRPELPASRFSQMWFSIDNLTTSLRYIALKRTSLKTFSSLHVLSFPRKCFYRADRSNGSRTLAYLHSWYLKMGLHVTIYKEQSNICFESYGNSYNLLYEYNLSCHQRPQLSPVLVSSTLCILSDESKPISLSNLLRWTRRK